MRNTHFLIEIIEFMFIKYAKTHTHSTQSRIMHFDEAFQY